VPYVSNLPVKAPISPVASIPIKAMDTSYVKGLRYEVIAKAIFQQILEEAIGVTVRIEHLAKVQGLRTHHDIDLLWEFEICGILYKTLVEAKNCNSRVKQEHVLAFKAVLDDIPGQPRGVIVSRSGFQRGARRVALASGIQLFQLGPMPKPPIELVVSGWMTMWLNQQTMQIERVLYNPRFRLEFKLASDTETSLQFDLRPLTEYLLFDELGNQLGTIMDVAAKFVAALHELGEMSATRTHTFEVPTYVRQEGRERQARIFGVTVDIAIIPEPLPPSPLLPTGFVRFVLKNLQTGDSSMHMLNSQAEASSAALK
jgi:hypothetical protein